MTEHKCIICNNWFSGRQIGIHYWNIHKVKYSEYRDKEETRETEENTPINNTKPLENIENEKNQSKESERNQVEERKVCSEERGTEKAQERKVINTFYKNPFDEDEGETINEWCS